MMGKKILSLLLALLLVLTLGACGKKDNAGDAPEESENSEETSAPEEEGDPEESEPEGDPSSQGEGENEDEDEELLPGVELPQSIYMTQVLYGTERSYPYWELEITDRKEIARLFVLLSTEGLTPLAGEQTGVPEDATPVEFRLDYANRSESRWAYPQPGFRVNGQGTLGAGEKAYACPAETCNALMSFLAEKYVQVVGADNWITDLGKELPSETEPPSGTELPPGTELPQAILMSQLLLGMDRVYPYWELEITDQKEITRLAALLSVKELTPLTKDQSQNPDGGTAILFNLEYADRTEKYWGYLQPGYRIERENGRGTLGKDGIAYACPAETCDAIMTFLEEKYVRVVN